MNDRMKDVLNSLRARLPTSAKIDVVWMEPITLHVMVQCDESDERAVYFAEMEVLNDLKENDNFTLSVEMTPPVLRDSSG